MDESKDSLHSRTIDKRGFSLSKYVKMNLKTNKIFLCVFKTVKTILNMIKHNLKLQRINTRIDWSDIQNYDQNLKQQYYNVFRKKLNLRNPKTLSEKMFWLRMYDNIPEKTILSDKILVRDWIKNKIGDEYLVPLYGVYNSFDEIDFSKLPKSFVLKTNHGCGTNLIVKDKEKFDKMAARDTVNKWLATNYFLFAGEWQYKDIKPRILIEKYIEDFDSDLPDYKYFCFNGKPYYIMYCFNRSIKEEPDNTFYDLSWQNMKFSYFGQLYDKDDVPAPKNLQKMNEIAEKLCDGFKHVRVDLYNIDGKIYFGEMTFTSYGGFIRFNPPKWNNIIGDLLKLQ